MANRFWVGGTAAWDATVGTKWSATSGGAGGASVPTVADDVFFDRALTYTVTITTTRVCRNITVSAGTVTFAGTGTLNVRGSMDLRAGTIWNATGLITFSALAADGGKTVITNGAVINSPITFNGVGGNWTLGSNLTLGANLTTTLTTGTILLSGYTLTTGIFSSSGSAARTITFGTGTIVLSNSTVATVLSMANATGFTCDNTSAGRFIVASTNSGLLETVVFGTTAGSTTNAPNLTVGDNTPGVKLNITDGSWFNTLTSTYTNSTINYSTGATTQVTGTYVDTLALSTANNYVGFFPNFTRTQTFTTTAGQQFAGIGFNLLGGTLTLVDSAKMFDAFDISTFAGTTTTTFALVAGTIDVTNAANSYNSSINYQLGFGRIISSNSNTRSINFGSNTIELGGSITPIVSMAITTGFTSTGAGGLIVDPSNATTITMGTTGTGGSSTNSCNVWVNWMSGYALTITTGSWFKTLIFTAINGNSSFGGTIGTTTVNCSSLEMAGTLSNLSVIMHSTGTITPNYFSNTLAGLTINSSATTLTNSVANPVPTLNCTTYTQTAGTFDFSTLNLTCSSNATYTSGTLLNIGTISCIQFIVNGNFTLTQGTIIPNATTGSFVVTNGASFNYNGGTLSAPTFTQTAGTVTLGQQLALIFNNSVYTLTSGTLNLNGFNLICGVFSSSGTGIRSIAFGSNNIILAANSNFNTTVLSMADASGFTYTGIGGFTKNMTINPSTFVFGTTGGTASNAPNLSLLSGSAGATFTTGSWFKTLNFGTSTLTVPTTTTLNLNGLILSSGGNFTNLTVNMVGSGTITSNTNTTLGALTINSGNNVTTILNDTLTLAATSTTTLTSGILNLNGFNLTTGRFVSENNNNRSIAFGTNNILLTHTIANTAVLSMAYATNFTCTGTGGFVVTDTNVARTITFATFSDTPTSYPDLTFTGTGSSVVTIATNSQFNTIDFGLTTFKLPETILRANSVVLGNGDYTALDLKIIGKISPCTVNGNEKTIKNFTVLNNSNITCLLTAPLKVTGQTDLQKGGLNLNTFTLTTGIFNSNTYDTRTLTFSAANIILTGPSVSGILLDFNSHNAFYVSATTGGFVVDLDNLVIGGSITSFPNDDSNSPNLTFIGNGSGSSIYFISNSKFKSLDFGITSFNINNYSAFLYVVDSLTLGTGSYTGLTLNLYNVNGNTTINGKGKTVKQIEIVTTNRTVTLLSNLTVNGTTTFYRGTLNLNNFTLTTNRFKSYYSNNTRTINFGTGNIELVSSASTGSSLLEISNATGFTCSGSGGFVTTIGYTGYLDYGKQNFGGNISTAPNLTYTGPAQAAQYTHYISGFYNSIDFGSSFHSSGSQWPLTTLNAASVKFSTNLTNTNEYNQVSIILFGTGTLTTYGRPFSTLSISHTGTTTLGSDIIKTGQNSTWSTISLQSGTLNLAGYTATATTFSSTASYGTARAINGPGTLSVANWQVSQGNGFTGTDYTLSLSGNTFAGASGKYGTLQLSSGTTTISGSNTFDNITTVTKPSTIVFTASTTQTLGAFTLSGAPGSLVTIKSLYDGIQSTLTSNGVVSCEYLNIKDIRVLGTATWSAGTGSINVSNNTGWSFDTASRSQFMPFFF